ncbi:MAG: hypothetical protein RLZZ338_531, partial [Cyanobacteriota bacterium]
NRQKFLKISQISFFWAQNGSFFGSFGPFASPGSSSPPFLLNTQVKFQLGTYIDPLMPQMSIGLPGCLTYIYVVWGHHAAESLSY